MESWKKVLATSAMMCLLTFSVAAQDQGSSSSSSQSSTSGNSMSSSSGQSGQLSAADKKFVMDAAKGGMMEVELGQLATQKASSDDVKQFGQKMVDDHSKANDQLKSIAQQKGVTLPTELDAKGKAMKDKLSNLSGEQFDKMYMQHMVKDHKKDVAEFKKESNSGKDNDVKNFASQTLPTLEGHLQQAQQVAGKTGASMGASNSKSSKSKKSSSSTMAGSTGSTTPKR